MNNPTVSIVVPTRNRAECARGTIDSLLLLNGNIQVVIHDNSTDNELERWIAAREHDARLVYVREATQLSFVDNFERAISLATGDYICVIGDDDNVHAEIVRVAGWASQHDIDAVVLLPVCTYIWPGAGAGSKVIPEAASGLLTVVPFTCRVMVSNVESELRRLLRNGGLYYLDFLIPKLYHGLVARRVIEVIRSRVGSVFGGLSPDTYAAFALACVCERVVAIDYPLTVHGASRTSGSVQEGALRRHSRDLAQAPHLIARGAYTWNEEVPRVYSVETLWVDSGLSALRNLRRMDLLAQFNSAEFTVKCALANRDVAAEVLQCYFAWEHSHGRNPILAVPPLLLPMGRAVLRAARQFFARVVTRARIAIQAPEWWRTDSVPDTRAAVATLSAHLIATARELRLPTNPFRRRN